LQLHALGSKFRRGELITFEPFDRPFVIAEDVEIDTIYFLGKYLGTAVASVAEVDRGQALLQCLAYASGKGDDARQKKSEFCWFHNIRSIKNMGEWLFYYLFR
jgi:hypothetical protein